jgi:hypothetical protein
MIIGMSGAFERHSYQATFNTGQIMDGRVACPSCGESTIHPTGHAMHVDSSAEYGPTVGVVGACECGQAVEIRLGNYKGHLGIDVAKLGW